ncbi:succinate-semialdehyde dehydrogenase / glutarate-semialdehyde dehydrogenase [Pedobacter suwonensis]|uniref:Succinate-semialdehyde dehydrogenase / glutarate-semialdehyde dehydrogenase n=1 Tax=Pedobacter suwonensis TaxID=332999 RepID=A0A1I0SLM5_9SPHI|nr:NAD-dependent succinate-semialdehyde dehydrogenase [Pedobacter suwonensis]SFA40313.1 succinate-semialdehyde dehydrogenase / glutarate-semialdehyde dehydrogenase [Pedobacter suwonensis]
MSISSINPINGEIIKKYREDTDHSIGQKIDQAHQAWLNYKETDFETRSGLLLQVSKLLTGRKDELAGLMALEMGKPLKAGVSEILKCAAVCEYYAKNGSGFLADQLIETDASKSYVSFQPIGVVLAIMPWNFPFWQVFRFLAPALMAGNAGVLKHSSGVTGCALEIERIIEDAGFPEHVFKTLICSSKAIPKVIENPYIKAVTLTGSTEAGKKVAEQAGKLIKKTVLELGGSDPYIILEDADLEEAAKICAEARLINNGQSCIAAKRFIVQASVAEKFTQLFKGEMESKRTGDPLLAETDLGPMARAELRDELHQQVLKSIEQGAKCILGGEIPSIAGHHAYYQPTILTQVNKGVLAYDEELFGPVAAIITAKDADDAIHIANDTNFGLGAAVFTKNNALAEDIARNKLAAGSCFVNQGVKSDVALPFGGINQSGYGRELSMFGIHEFVNIKTVYIK